MLIDTDYKNELMLYRIQYSFTDFVIGVRMKVTKQEFIFLLTI